MRRSYYGPPRWKLISPDLDRKNGFQHWNLVIILILGFIVVGSYVAAIGSELINQASPITTHTLSDPPQPPQGLYRGTSQ